MKPAVVVALWSAWWVPALAGEVPPDGGKVTDFIRVDEDAGAARLQTAVTRYSKDGAGVDLIGAIHIADQGYYKALERRFAGYDAVLFEMIGGEEIGARKADPAAAAGDDNLQALHQIYTLVSRFLGLADQMSQVDYTRDNFVHADLSLAEFRDLQAARGESLIGFALEAGLKAGEGRLAKQPDMAALVQAMLTGDSNKMKLGIVHTLGAGDDQIAAFAGDNVIIGDRNAKCLKVLGDQLAAGKRRLAVFYGAAHFPDLERRMLESGWRRDAQEWLTAWDIPKAGAKKPAPEPG